MFVFRHMFVRSHVYPTVSLIKSTNWKNSICLHTLKVDANDRSAQELQNGLYNGFTINFWLRYGHFNIIQFYITKGYLVTFYNTNIGKKPRLVRWNPWVENIYGARWYGTPLHVPMLGSSPAGQPQGTPTCRAGTCRVFSDHGFLSEITSFWVFRTYLQGLKKN